MSTIVYQKTLECKLKNIHVKDKDGQKADYQDFGQTRLLFILSYSCERVYTFFI